MNPCPCGYAGDPSGKCNCSGEQIQRYRARISGPRLDRIALPIEVPRPPAMVMNNKGPQPECSASIRQRVIAAREIQLARTGQPNAHLNSLAVTKHCSLDKVCHQLLEDAARQRFLSPRACQRILKVARTLADLEARESISQTHLAEAISYRMAGPGHIQY